MKKTKLQLNDLHVESFEVQSDAPGIGTVRALELNVVGSGVHSECYTHCATGACEACDSVQATHCDRDCPSWNGSCPPPPPPPPPLTD